MFRKIKKQTALILALLFLLSIFAPAAVLAEDNGLPPELDNMMIVGNVGVSIDLLFDDNETAREKINDALEDPDVGLDDVLINFTRADQFFWLLTREAPTADEIADILANLTGFWDAEGEWVPWPLLPDIVDTAIAADDFNTLVAAVVEADLVDALKAEGPFTVFAPTDEAFENLLADLGITADDLLASEDLADILLYHVVDGAVFSGDLTDGMEVATLQGQTVTITIDDEDVFVNDAQVVIPDIECSNGVIHAIDAVLLPDPFVDLEVFDVSDADELYDALLNQCDYDMIRLIDDVDGVDFDVRLFCDGLIFNINGNTLTLDEDYNFEVEGDNIQVLGSTLELQGEGKFLVEGTEAYLQGLTITTDDEDFYVDTGGDITLTIVNCKFYLGDGSFYVRDGYGSAAITSLSESVTIDPFNEPKEAGFPRIAPFGDRDIVVQAAQEGAVIDVAISGSIIDAYGFEVYADGKDAAVTVNLDNSDFDLSGYLYVGAWGEGGSASLNVSGSDFNIASFGGWFWFDAKAEMTANISDSTVTTEGGGSGFGGYADGVITVDIINSDFDIGWYFYVGAWGAEDEGEATLNITDSDFELGDWFWFDAREMIADISGSTFESENRGFGGGANDALTVNITDSSVVTLGDNGEVYFGAWEEGSALNLNISDSDFEIDGDGGFYIDAEYLDQVVNIDITESGFFMNDSDFQVWADDGASGTDATVNIIDCEFYDVAEFNFDADGGYLESLIFGSVDYGLDWIWLVSDTTINGLTFEEGIGYFEFYVGDCGNPITLNLNGDIILEHEDNEMALSSEGSESQLRGNGNTITGEGKVSTDDADDMAIFNLVFEVPFEINDDINLVNCTLAASAVDNANVTISGTVNLNDDMTVYNNATISADRAPFPLEEGVTVRGTLLGVGDVTIGGMTGDVNALLMNSVNYNLNLGDKLMVENVTLSDLDGLYIWNDATVVFKDVTLDTDLMEINSGATLVFGSDILVTKDLNIYFASENSTLDFNGFCLVADDDETLKLSGAEGTLIDPCLLIDPADGAKFIELDGPAELVPGGNAVYTATVLTEDGGDPVEGVTVTFTVTPADAGLGSVEFRERITDSDGKATYTLVLTNSALVGAEYTVTASIDDEEYMVVESASDSIVVEVVVAMTL